MSGQELEFFSQGPRDPGKESTYYKAARTPPHPTPHTRHRQSGWSPGRGWGVGWSRAHGPRVSDRCDSPQEPTSAAAGRQGPHKPSLGTSSCREMGGPLTSPRSSDGGPSGSGSQGDSQAHLSWISSSSPCLLPRGLVLPGSGRQKTPRAGVG